MSSVKIFNLLEIDYTGKRYWEAANQNGISSAFSQDWLEALYLRRSILFAQKAQELGLSSRNYFWRADASMTHGQACGLPRWLSWWCERIWEVIDSKVLNFRFTFKEDLSRCNGIQGDWYLQVNWNHLIWCFVVYDPCWIPAEVKHEYGIEISTEGKEASFWKIFCSDTCSWFHKEFKKLEYRKSDQQVVFWMWRVWLSIGIGWTQDF